MDAKRDRTDGGCASKATSHPKALTSSARLGDLERVLSATEALAVTTRLSKGFTTNALARVGILSVGAIHKHLGSREDIIQKLMERQETRLRAALNGVQRGNKAILIMESVQVVVAQVYAQWPLIEILELERRRFPIHVSSGFGAVLKDSLTTGFNDPGVTVRKPVTLIAGLLTEVMMTMAIQAQKSGLAEAKAAAGIVNASLVLIEDPIWWS